MQPTAARKGMSVIFGQGNGQRTLAEILKLNPTKAKVKTLEHRGQHGLGRIWNVPYELMEEAPADAKPGTHHAVPPPPKVMLSDLCETP